MRSQARQHEVANEGVVMSELQTHLCVTPE